jgi:hypothetical protein
MTNTEKQLATEILFDNGIDIRHLDDNFNTSMLQAMQEYKEQGIARLVEEYNALSVWKQESGN